MSRGLFLVDVRLLFWCLFPGVEQRKKKKTKEWMFLVKHSRKKLCFIVISSPESKHCTVHSNTGDVHLGKVSKSTLAPNQTSLLAAARADAPHCPANRKWTCRHGRKILPHRHLAPYHWLNGNVSFICIGHLKHTGSCKSCAALCVFCVRCPTQGE